MYEKFVSDGFVSCEFVPDGFVSVKFVCRLNEFLPNGFVSEKSMRTDSYELNSSVALMNSCRISL